MLLEIQALDFFLRLLEFTIPALVVFLVTYITMRRFLEEEYKKKLLELKRESQQDLLPIRLQAYERLTLLMDRLKPDNLIMRLNEPDMNATVFKYVLEKNIRDEYAHNVAQQIYVSSQAWILVTAVKDEMLRIVSNAYKDMKEDSTGAELGKVILQEVIRRNDRSADEVIEFLKKEIELIF
ncbi:MAG: hypothetical protein H6606_04935 [Flavobacteriales bacterium]|nr:hypothetical protein [Flavobacteriales bacterium]